MNMPSYGATFQSNPKIATVAGFYSIFGCSHNLARLQPASKQTSPPISKTTTKTCNDSTRSNDLVSAMISGMEKNPVKAIKAAQKSKKKKEGNKKLKNQIDHQLVKYPWFKRYAEAFIHINLIDLDPLFNHYNIQEKLFDES